MASPTSDDIEIFHNFAQDLIKLIPINANDKNRGKKSEKSDETSQNSKNLSKKEARKLKSLKKNSSENGKNSNLPSTNAELRERLQAKLQNLKTSREGKKAFNAAEAASMKNKQVMKREAKNAKRKRALDKQKDGEKPMDRGGNLKKGQEDGDQKKSKTPNPEGKKEVENTISDPSPSKKSKISTSNLEYNSSTFVTGHEATAAGGLTLTKKEKKSSLEGKATKKQLETAEKLQNTLKNLKENDPEEHKKMVKEIAWDKAFKHAEGVKVNDDVAKIKKSLKNEARRKKKSTKEWSDRADKVKDDMDERQKKRKTNIQDRADKKKKKKMDGLRKRGRIL